MYPSIHTANTKQPVVHQHHYYQHHTTTTTPLLSHHHTNTLLHHITLSLTPIQSYSHHDHTIILEVHRQTIPSSTCPIICVTFSIYTVPLHLDLTTSTPPQRSLHHYCTHTITLPPRPHHQVHRQPHPLHPPTYVSCYTLSIHHTLPPLPNHFHTHVVTLPPRPHRNTTSTQSTTSPSPRRGCGRLLSRSQYTPHLVTFT